MPIKKLIRRILFLTVVFFMACTLGGKEEPHVRPLVYEGMPINELIEILGNPDSVVSGGTVYHADYNKSLPIHKWYYKTRTVLVINDSVKTPQIKER